MLTAERSDREIPSQNPLLEGVFWLNCPQENAFESLKVSLEGESSNRPYLGP